MSDEKTPPSVENSPESPLKVELEVIAGPHIGRRFSFGHHDSFLVGRSSWSHFRLPQKDVYFSRTHFMLEINPPFCHLYDMASRNGTFVNGERVATTELRDGDRIQGGRTVIRVSLSMPQQESPPTEVSAAPPPLAPTVEFQNFPFIDGYRIVSKLGQGGMGVVYLAERTGDQARVAIKTIRPAVAGSQRQIQLFLREASILAKLQHPNIVSFHEAGQSGEVLFFVMDFVDGISAMTLLRQSGTLATDRAVRLASQALDALQYAHAIGYVHRDVKPGNMLVENVAGEERCMLADFGLARVYHASCMSGLTMVGDYGGTVPYMPPEQIVNYREALPPADQYSAAASLYTLLTGRFLFDFGDEPQHKRLLKVLHEQPIPIQQRRPDIPGGLADAIHRALNKDPRRRFTDVAAFRAAILPFANVR